MFFIFYTIANEDIRRQYFPLVLAFGFMVAVSGYILYGIIRDVWNALTYSEEKLSLIYREMVTKKILYKGVFKRTRLSRDGRHIVVLYKFTNANKK
jgi:hypothetical protein